MSVTAIQCRAWAEGLSVSQLLFDDIIAAEEIYLNELHEAGNWYWDGDPEYHLANERRRLRRKLEDYIRKDKMAFANAARAVFGDD